MSPKGEKVLSLEGLAEVLKSVRSVRNEVVVLAHGTFDLLHFGHVRHLQAAAALGSRLVVTVTADKHVNKGPGRPVFPESSRAEMLAALECVDWVAVSDEATSLSVIEALQPDIYVKGSEYANEAEDVTGNITRERLAVERYGGRLTFTSDVVFSSSNLINRYVRPRDPELNSFLDGLRTADLMGDLTRLVERVRNMKVLVIGDAIIDQYDFVVPLGKPPKESIIATRHEGREVFAGGVIAAANHVASFSDHVEVITMTGDDNYRDVVFGAVKPNVQLTALTRTGSPTTRKIRYIEQAFTRKLFEVYHFNDQPIVGHDEAAFLQAIEARIDAADLVLVTDFGHGLITPAAIELLTRRARFLAVNAQSNSANHGFNLISRYSRADFICIDAPEARLATGDKHGDIESIVAEKLPRLVACDNIIVTHGRLGCIAFNPAQGLTKIPALTSSVVDTIGAGDAFLAVTSPLVAAGGSMDQVAFLGNAAGAIKVGILGHRTAVERAPLLRFVSSLLK